jgi:phage major head subunit gpT-like protein
MVSSQATSTGDKETYIGLGAHPFPVEAVDRVQVRGLNERYVEIENKDWEVTLALDHNAINDDRVGHVLPWARGAGSRFEQHMDERVFLALNGGDGTTYGSCYDGFELFDTLHVDASAEYTTAQSNLNTLTLNTDNFNTVWVAAKTFRDARGKFINVPFNLLVVAPALRTVAAQICENANVYGTANREINPYAEEFSYLVNPNMDATAWILTSTVLPDKPIIFQLRQAPKLVVWDDENVAAGVRYMKWLARYEVGYGDWRTCYMGKT